MRWVAACFFSLISLCVDESIANLNEEKHGVADHGMDMNSHTASSRERAILLVGQMTGQLIAFDAWTGEIINSIDSGGPLVTNCRDDVMRDLQPDSESVQFIQQQARNDVAIHSTRFDHHNFAPTMDGRLYHMNKHSGEWKEVLVSSSKLLQSKKPIRSKLNPELSNVLFVAEKQQRLYTFEVDTGQMYPFYSPDAAASSSSDQVNVLMGRVDVTTKMLNLEDVMDFKCVTVSEYFVQIATLAQCDKNARVGASPWIELEVSHDTNVVSLTGYDPKSRRILWKWNSHFDLTMIYGMLPKQGIKFYEWSVSGPLLDEDSQSEEESCPSSPLVEAKAEANAVSTQTLEMAQRNLLYRTIDGQTYLLPSPKETILLEQPDNGTGKGVVIRQRSWNLKTIEIDGEKGVLLTSQHVMSIVISVVIVVMLVAYVFYRKGLVAKPEKESTTPPSTPTSVATPTPPNTPTMKAMQEPESGPRSPLFRHKTGLEQLLHLVSPAKMHRSLSFGGFPHTSGLSSLQNQSSKAEWKSKLERLSDLGPRLSDISNELSADSAPSEALTTPKSNGQPLPTTTTGGGEEFSKILPYICKGRFANEFEELSILGKGGFGQVMLAENRLDGRQYAVKRIGLSLRNQTKPTLEKFLREVKILARLDHTYIVRYYQAWLEELGENDIIPSLSEASYGVDRKGSPLSSVYTSRNILQHRSSDESSDSLYGPSHHYENHYNENDQDDGFEWDRGDINENDESMAQWSESELISSIDTFGVQDNKIDHWLYIQMQYCSEESLADLLMKQDHIMSLSKRFEIFYQIASALEHVHSLGLIHRDLKPANIFVMDCSTIKLGDFGLSRYAGTPSIENETIDCDMEWNSLDDEKTVGVGTYLYASPEQISGDIYCSKADMYSLGMILFELMHQSFGTSMERIIKLRNLRDGILPLKWYDEYPTILNMIKLLVSNKPIERPNAHDVVIWCQNELNNNKKKKNIFKLQVEAIEFNNSTLCHNLLLLLCDVIYNVDKNIKIIACGLKQHMSGQVLEFTLYIEKKQIIEQIINTISIYHGVKQVEQLN